MKLAAPFVKAAMGHVNRARVFICEKIPPVNRDPVSSPLSSRFAEARFAHINTNQLYTANEGRRGVSANRGPRQSGQKRATFSNINRPLD